MNRIIIVLSCMLFLLLTANLYAESVKLDEVVVTATRTEERVENISSDVSVITKEDINRSTATTVQELLENEHGLNIRDQYGMGTKTTIDMRGFSKGVNTVILIDGRRVNEIDLSGVDWNTIPLENVERIEVVRGNGNVLYGDNAMAGVINIIIKKGVSKKPQVEFDGRLSGYNGNTEHASIKGTTDKLNYYLLLKQSNTDGYRDNSEFNSNDINTKLSASVSDTISVKFAAGYHNDHQGYPGGLTESELDDNRRQTLYPDDGADYDQYFYGIDADSVFTRLGNLEFGYSFNSREFDANFSGFNIKRDTDTEGIKVKLTSNFGVFEHKSILISGIDLYRSLVDNKSSYLGLTTISDISKRDVGIYVNHEFFISNKLSSSLGYRHSDTEFKDTVTGFSSGKGEQTFREDALKIGITYNYDKGSKGFVSYSRGYRLPTTDELFSFDGTIVDLKPERSDAYEAGIVHSLSEILETRLTLYAMDIEDELFYNPAGGLFGFGANENIDKTRHIGSEFGLTANLYEFISLYANWTYSQATFESGPYEGNTIPLVPNHSANIGTDVRLNNSILLALKCNWVGERFLDSDVGNDSDKVDDYWTVDSRLSYKYKKTTAYIGINNMFNEEYSEYGVFVAGTKSFYPAPERQYYGGIKISL